MKRLVWPSLPSLLIVVATICVPTVLLRAQTTFGIFVGTVEDKPQAAIPGASVSVTNVETGISRQAKTDQFGNCRVESQLPGTYRISAERTGFKSVQIKLGITSRQDPTDRVRAVRRSRPESAGRGKTRDLHLPGFYPLLWATPQERNLHRMADHCYGRVRLRLQHMRLPFEHLVPRVRQYVRERPVPVTHPRRASPTVPDE